MRAFRLGEIGAAILLASAFVVPALGAQDGLEQPGNDNPPRTTTREQIREQNRDGDQDRLRLRIRDRIRANPDLDEAQIRRMEQNLERCLERGWDEARVEAMFPMQGTGDRIPAPRLLQLQERVLLVGEEGMPADLLADKLREGRMKGVGPEALERAMHRMEQQVRAASRVMAGAVGDGVEPHPDRQVEQRLLKGLALNLWRGLNEGDAEALREQARLRLQDGSCATVDLAAAAESATEWIEAGVERTRARELMGLALRQGFTAEEMRQIGWLARSRASAAGETPEEMLAWMHRNMGEGMGLQRMAREMERHGWLGPRDLQGPGGGSPVDDVLGGPGRQGGGSGTGPQGPGGQGASGSDPTQGGSGNSQR